MAAQTKFYAVVLMFGFETKLDTHNIGLSISFRTKRGVEQRTLLLLFIWWACVNIFFFGEEL